MAGEAFSYEDVTAPATSVAPTPAVTASDPSSGPGFVYAGQDAYLPPAQAQVYGGLQASGQLDPGAQPGTLAHPRAQMAEGDLPGPGEYYVPVGGGGVQQVPGQPPAFNYEEVAPNAGQPPKPVSEALGFEQGLFKPLANLNSDINKVPILRTLLGADAPSTVAAQAGAQAWMDNQAKTAQPGKIGTAAGEIVGTAPVAFLPGGLAVQGAAAGALLTDHPNDPAATGFDAVKGAAGAWLGGKLIGGALSRIVAPPSVSPQVQALIDAKVPLTPGQIAGGIGKRLEDAATSWPFLGDAIRNSQRASIAGFNRAALNRGLAPIGETMPTNINVGRDGVGYVQDRLGAAYDAIAPQLKAAIDQPFVQGVRTIRSNIAPRALDNLPTFDQIVNDQVLSRYDPATGALDGQAAKDAQTAIGQSIKTYSPSSDPKVQALVEGLKGLQEELGGSLARNSPPEAASQLQKINTGWANFKRVQAAAASVGTERAADGMFTPAQLSSAVRVGDASVGHGQFARGDALLQDLSSAGQQVLPSSVPDSGTALRALLAEAPMIVGFGAESQHFLPQLAATAIASGIPGLAYTKGGQRIVQAVLTQRPWSAATAQTLLGPLRAALARYGAIGGQQVPLPGAKPPQLQLPAPQ